MIPLKWSYNIKSSLWAALTAYLFKCPFSEYCGFLRRILTHCYRRLIPRNFCSLLLLGIWFPLYCTFKLVTDTVKETDMKFIKIDPLGLLDNQSDHLHRHTMTISNPEPGEYFWYGWKLIKAFWKVIWPKCTLSFWPTNFKSLSQDILSKHQKIMIILAYFPQL